MGCYGEAMAHLLRWFAGFKQGAFHSHVKSPEGIPSKSRSSHPPPKFNTTPETLVDVGDLHLIGAI